MRVCLCCEEVLKKPANEKGCVGDKTGRRLLQNGGKTVEPDDGVYINVGERVWV